MNDYKKSIAIKKLVITVYATITDHIADW